MKVEWSEPAVEDLRSLHAYIAKDSAHYAASFIERLLDAAEQLVDFPESGGSFQSFRRRTFAS